MRCPKCGCVRKWYLFTTEEDILIFSCKECRTMYDGAGNKYTLRDIKKTKMKMKYTPPE